MEEFQALEEVTGEIHQPKLHQEISDFLASGFLGLTYVGFKVSHHDGVLVPEAYQGLLQIWEVLQGGEGEILHNEQVPLISGDDLTDYHVRPMEEH